MGLEARCQGRYGHASGEGRLQHEGDKILFRGAFRLDLAVKDLKAVTASADDLVLSWGKEKAWFTLGAAVAPKWVRKILNPPTLLDKLGIKPGQLVAHKGKFDAAFLDELATRVEPTTWRATATECDVLLLLAQTAADLKDIPAVVGCLTQSGALWVVYPKGGAAIKESEVRQAGLAANLVDNKTCAFSTTLTALRWVRPRALRV